MENSKYKYNFILWVCSRNMYKYKYIELKLEDNGDINIYGFNNKNTLETCKNVLCHKSYNLGDELKENLLLMYDIYEELSKFKIRYFNK